MMKVTITYRSECGHCMVEKTVSAELDSSFADVSDFLKQVGEEAHRLPKEEPQEVEAFKTP